MTTLKTSLHAGLQLNQFALAEVVEDQLVAYLEMLQLWNRVFNLTAIRDPEEMVFLHIVDSLLIHPFLHGNRVLDVGSGAGFPGIPLALINPEKKFILLDSNHKKTRFLTQVVADLTLKNVEVVHARSEGYQPECCFDSILSRAFATLRRMLISTQHLICPAGQFLAMKGVYPQDEIAAIPPGFEIGAVHHLDMKGWVAERCLVCIKSVPQNG